MANWNTVLGCIALMVFTLFFFSEDKLIGFIILMVLGLFMYLARLLHPYFRVDKSTKD